MQISSPLLRHNSPFRLPLRSPNIIHCWHAYSTPSASSLIHKESIPAPHTGHITVLTLNSPANKNAISRQLLAELSAEINAIRVQWGYDTKSAPDNASQTSPQEPIANDNNPHPHDISSSTRALILGSAIPSVFCAGADLKERRGMTPTETASFLSSLRHTLGQIATLPIPSIAAVSGFALGGGLELSLATTFRVFASTATVGLPETRLGIIPGAGGTVRLRELVGRAKAADLILTGRRVTGREAYGMGICERLVVGEGEEDGRGWVVKEGREEREKTIEVAVKMAKKICEGGPLAIGAALRAVGTGVGWLPGGLEDQMYERVVGTKDRDEALLAFQEKRKPKFTGS